MNVLISTKPYIICLEAVLVGVTVWTAVSLSAATPLGTSTKRADFLKEQNQGRLASFKDAVPAVSSWLRSFPILRRQPWSLSSVSGLQHAEAAFVDGLCVRSEHVTMAALRSRLSLLTGMGGAPSVTTRTGSFYKQSHRLDCFIWDHFSTGCTPESQDGHGTLRVNITQECRRSFSPWTDLAFLRAGVPLEQVSRHVVITTDASSTGWGATCNGQAASGLWMGPRLLWHINCLELLAVHLALRQFRLLLLGKHVLVRTDNTVAVSYINRMGGIRSHRMSQLARHLLLWSHTWLKSLRAVHIPGEINRAADALSGQLTFPGEWRLHPRRSGWSGVDSGKLR